MNALDIVILVLFIPGIIRGLSKGFVEQAISLAGIAAAIWAANKYHALAAEKISEYIQGPENAVQIIAFTAVLLAVIVVVMIIAKIITGAVKMANLGWVNKLLGVVFGVAVSAVVISLLAILVDTVNLRFDLIHSPVLTESILFDSLKDLGYAIFP